MKKKRWVRPRSGLRHFSSCMNAVIERCEMAQTVFTGCADVAQVAARVFELLGDVFDVVRGKVRTFDGETVHHVWIELPKESLRAETNPSQVLGIPTYAMIVDMRDHSSWYREIERGGMELLPPVTEAGERFFAKMAEDLIRCMLRD